MTPAQMEGGLVGLLVGDALGVPYEFHVATSIPKDVEMIPPDGFRRSHVGTPPGTWSDDGAHALCLLASLLHGGRVDVDDLGRRLVNWWHHGYLAVDGRVFDIGTQTSSALSALEAGVPADRAGPADEQANGNGSLMRVLPLALWHRGTDRELVGDARKQSLVTHGHVRSQVCCALYCLWARRTAEGLDDAFGAAVEALRPCLDAPAIDELDRHVLAPGRPGGTGYVVDCLRSARWAVAQGSYETAVRAAISLGADTDTTACVAGGIAGLRDGVDAIPERWREALRGRDLLAPLLDALLAQAHD